MLRDHAFADCAHIFESDGVPVTFIASDGREYPTKGQVTRIDAENDPQTGVQVVEPKTVVSVALSGLEIEPDDNGWRVRTTDATGEEINRRIAGAPRYDRTIGFVTVVLEEYDG